MKNKSYPAVIKKLQKQIKCLQKAIKNLDLSSSNNPVGDTFEVTSETIILNPEGQDPIVGQVWTAIDETGEGQWQTPSSSSSGNSTKIILSGDAAVANTSKDIFTFNSTEREVVGAELASFSTNTLTVLPSSSRVKIEAFLFATGNFDLSSVFYFSETSGNLLDVGETLENSVSIKGEFGNKSSHKPSTAILPPRTLSTTLNLVFEESIENQVIQEGSLIIITEI